MLKDVLRKSADYTDDHKKLDNLHQHGLLAVRTIRSCAGCLTSFDLAEIIADLDQEIKSLRAGRNSKHNGPGHFSTILLLKGKPISTYTTGVGLLFDVRKLKVKALCDVDAQDDNGIMGKHVKLAKDYPEYHDWIRNKTPQKNSGVIEDYPEAQLYCNFNSCVGIFATINARKDLSHEQCEQSNIFAYLTAVAVGNMIFKRHKINWPVYLYDVTNGAVLRPAARNPSPQICKELISYMCTRSSTELTFPETDRTKIRDILIRLKHRLNFSWTDEQLIDLIEKTRLASFESKKVFSISHFGEIMANSCFPESIILRGEGNVEQEQFEIVIPFDSLNFSGLKKRFQTMLNTLNLKLAKYDTERVYVISLTRTQLDNVNRYFYHDETPLLREESIEHYNQLYQNDASNYRI